MSFIEELKRRTVFRIGSSGINGGVSNRQKSNWTLLKFVKFVVNNLITKSPQETSSASLFREIRANS